MSKGSLLGRRPQERRNRIFSGDAGTLRAFPNWVSRPSEIVRDIMLGSCVKSISYISVEGDKSAKRTALSGIFSPEEGLRYSEGYLADRAELLDPS